jgi:diguanylate cyclase (GGDEF)-like protein
VRKASLLRNFAILSAITMALAGVVLAQVLSRQVQERVLDEASQSAKLFAQSGVQPLLSEEDLGDDPSAERLAALDRFVQRAVAGGRIARIKVWDRYFRIVYSDDPRLIGKAYPASDDLELALEGRLVSEISDLDEEEEAIDRGHGQLLEVYVPLWFPDKVSPWGAFEMYLPYRPIARAIEADTRELYLVLLGALLVLWAVLFRIVSRASKTMHRQAAQNEHLALHDPLTDLPNRSLFRDRIDQAVRTARRDGTRLAVLIIDLDRFKEINDTLGHHTGDLLLQQVGPRLQGTLRDSDSVARLGGDEFGVLVPSLTEVSDAWKVADKIRTSMEEPFTAKDMTLEVEASIGFALYPDHAGDVDELLQRADVAMYVAKEARTGYEAYAVERDKYSPERLSLLGELRRAIDNGEIVLHYQPKVNISTGRPTGVEALARWQHPQRGLLPPDQFIPLAEPTGLMGPLTAYILERAVGQCRAWRDQGLDLGVAVNISVRNLQDPGFAYQVVRILRERDLEPEHLELEITESAIMQEPTRALEVVKQLRAVGVRLSIDDFGIGHSSLAYLKRLPVGELKIDRSFVMNLPADENDSVIVRSTIDLGRNLGLNVVAEGVETEEALKELATLGCHVAQGFYLSRPLPPEDLTGWLQEAQERAGAAASASLEPAT